MMTYIFSHIPQFLGYFALTILVTSIYFFIKGKINHEKTMDALNRNNDEEAPVYFPEVVNDTLPNLDELHASLKICTFEKKIVSKAKDGLNLKNEEEFVQDMVPVCPHYEYEENGIRILFPRETDIGKIPSIKHLKDVASEYSLFLRQNIDSKYLVADHVVPEETSSPWEFFFRYLTEDVQLEKEIISILQKNGVYYKNALGETLYPKVFVDTDDLLFDCKGVPMSKELVEKSCIDFSTRFAKNFRFVKKENSNTYRMIDLKPRADRYFPYGTKVFGQREKLLDLISKGQALVKKKGMEVMLLGEIEDPVIQLETQVFTTINDFVHGVVVGQTGSGKSTTLLSTTFINAMINKIISDVPDIYYFADGKSGGDFDLPAKFLSDYPVAQKSSGSDPMIELANIFHLVWAEYMRRQRIFREAREEGKSVRNIFEYRQHVGPLPRVWVIVDEFKAFLGDMDFDSLTSSHGSIPNMLVRLFAEARSFGFTFIFASQRFQQDSFPTVLRSNLPSRLVHNVQASDLGVLQMESIPNLEKGGYMLKVEGVTCPRTNSNQIQCRMPYLGSTEELKELFTEFFPMRKHQPFDYDLIYNKGQATNFDKMTINEVWLLVKKLFIQEQKFVIKEQYSQDHHADTVDIIAYLEHEQFPNGVGFGILKDTKEIGKEIYERNKTLVEKIKADIYVFFVENDINKAFEKEVEAWKTEGVIPNNFFFVSYAYYQKPLKRALADYEEQKENTFFRDFLLNLHKSIKVMEFVPREREPSIEGGKAPVRAVFKDEDKLPDWESKTAEYRERLRLFNEEKKFKIAQSRTKKNAPADEKILASMEKEVDEQLEILNTVDELRKEALEKGLPFETEVDSTILEPANPDDAE